MNHTFEPLVCADAISGPEVAFDIASCVENALAKDNRLSGFNAYGGYSAVVTITLQLNDVDTTQFEQSLSIGALDSGQPSQQITVEVEPTTPDVLRQRCSLPVPSAGLERHVDGSAPATAPQRAKRVYVRSKS